MDNNKLFNKLTKDFVNLAKKDELNINTIEILMLSDIENYKKLQKEHIEYLLQNNINEKELINKKKNIGINKDLN